MLLSGLHVPVHPHPYKHAQNIHMHTHTHKVRQHFIGKISNAQEVIGLQHSVASPYWHEWGLESFCKALPKQGVHHLM